MSKTLIHTIEKSDVGKTSLQVICPTWHYRRTHSLSEVLGRIQNGDVRKRIYKVDGVLQVENDEQLKKRKTGEEDYEKSH